MIKIQVILFVLLFFPKWFQHIMKNTEISLSKLLMKLYIFSQWHLMGWIVRTKFICFTEAQNMALYVFLDTIEKLTVVPEWVGPWSLETISLSM